MAQPFEALLKRDLAPLLKREGYKKSGQIWRRTLEACTQITAAESADHGDEPGRFTLSLAVYYPEVDELGRATAPQPRPEPAHCVIREWIGALMPAPADHWWRAEAEVEDERLAREVADTWLAYAKPWLESQADPAVAQEWLVGKDELYWAAVFALYRQRPNEAAALLRGALESADAESSAYVFHMRAWGAAHGLL
jgi:hypothetical protein